MLVLVGFLAASPLAYLMIQRWLAEFAYHIEIGLGVFLMAAAVMIVIAAATISYHVVRASLANPVDSLQYE